MIRKLRVRFIILSTASLLLLLGIIVISSSVLTYRELVENADRVLAMLAENGVHPCQSCRRNRSGFPGRMRRSVIKRSWDLSGAGRCLRRACMRQGFLP